MSTPKATGFMAFKRQAPIERDPLERVNDWIELYVHQPDDVLASQGQRCMDCGVPFCHTPQTKGRSTSGCPISNLIPEWNDLVYRGLWREAYERLDKTNNFPEFTGRTCPAPCEGACVLGISDPAVTIKSIENAIIDRAFENGWVTPNIPHTRTDKKIAVIGSGPAGLTCADQLNKVGHHVTVFERDDRIGGLMMYGIPAMKMDKRYVQRRVDLLVEAGITFKTNVNIGVDLSMETLQNEYDAVVMAIGAKKPRGIENVPGHELEGIHFAMDFLSANTKSLLDSELADGNYISADKRNVIVIGGGDTGTDCVATSMRHGCSSVKQFEIMDRPPLERAADNPWPEYPKLYFLDYGHKEAKAKFGTDPRRYATLTKEFIGDENGRVMGLRTVDIEWRDHSDNGLPWVELVDSERVWDADLVLLAMGFTGPDGNVVADAGVETDNYANVKAAHGDFQTNVEGIFTAGDARRGQSLVVWAINEGRGCAREVDRFLMGETDLP